MLNLYVHRCEYHQWQYPWMGRPKRRDHSSYHTQRQQIIPPWKQNANYPPDNLYSISQRDTQSFNDR